MNNVTYGVSEEHYSLDNRTRISYGIVAYADADADGIVAIIASVRDISPDKQRIERLAEQLNRLELSPAHLYDVIADFLAE